MELRSSKDTSIRYHNIFDYKLTKKELVRWQYKSQKIGVSKAWPTSLVKNKSRLQREKYSIKKLKIAKKAAKLLSKISTVKFIGITGALAMNNAGKNSDIDLMMVTKKDTLWLTRLISYVFIWVFGFKTRKPENKDQKNALCLNMWMDESDLIWDKKDRNIYTAHEIAQIVPIVNKDKIYEKFLCQNRWILNYWPNAVKINNPFQGENCKLKIVNSDLRFNILEKIAYIFQYRYMKAKMTREVVTPTRAIFHPNDWGKMVLKKLELKPR
jgi:D-beta-D-heptose 7-phosphate kinase/D-beta-D-heptose 1-phosphate adenosyltransferase